MKTSRDTQEQIIAALKQHRAGLSTGEQRSDVLHLWTALPVRDHPRGFVANIYPASSDQVGAPKWGIRSRMPQQVARACLNKW